MSDFDSVCRIAANLQRVLNNILNAHDSKNCGAYIGEAVLCRMFADEARIAIQEANSNPNIASKGPPVLASQNS